MPTRARRAIAPMRTEIRGSIWFSFYRFLILFPLILGAVFQPPGGGRRFVVSFGVACGYVGLSIVALEFSLVARLKHVAGAFGQDALQQFHKQMGYVSTLFLLAHPILLFTSGFPLESLNPFSQAFPWAWRWGTIAFYVLLVLVGLSAGRRLFRMSFPPHLGKWILLCRCRSENHRNRGPWARIRGIAIQAGRRQPSLSRSNQRLPAPSSAAPLTLASGADCECSLA